MSAISGISAVTVVLISENISMAGALSGMVSKTLTAPLERLKVIYQVQSNPPPMLDVLKNIWKESGWRGFFRSNGANVLKIAPEMALKFWSFETMMDMFADKDGAVTTLSRLSAAGISGAFSHSFSYPLDVVKTRMAITSGKHAGYSGITSTIRNIQATEGYVLPFFRGWSLMLMATLPSNALTLGVFSTLKDLIMSRNKKGEISPSLVAGCSTASSVFGTIITYPLGVLKSRLQVQGIPGLEKKYNGLIDAVTKIYRGEGFVGFYRGLTATMIKHVPSQTISLVTYDMLRSQFGLDAKHKKH